MIFKTMLNYLVWPISNCTKNKTEWFGMGFELIETMPNRVVRHGFRLNQIVWLGFDLFLLK